MSEYPKPVCYYCKKDLNMRLRLYSPFMNTWMCATKNCINIQKQKVKGCSNED